ncbi:MAG TPA: tyrosine-type recombinase/integrase [Firmicutes bacterium]|nr:tyrosine-type recombinase/integrase [Candidatus Fermentithermobacillaceae bacterium]
MSSATVRGYLCDVRSFARWFSETLGEKFSPSAVTPVDVREYFASMRDQKPATLVRKLRALNRFFRWAQSVGLVKSNPVSGIKAPREQRKPPKALSEQELYRLKRAVYRAGKPRDIAMFELLTNAGLRVGELCALRVGDVSLSERKGKVIVRRGKGNKYREVPLNIATRKALAAYLSTCPGVDANEPLLVGQRGARTPSGVWRTLQSYAGEAGVAVSPHVLRHTFATRLLRKAGADLPTVRDLLGHEKLETTAIYTKPREEDMEAAVERLN